MNETKKTERMIVTYSSSNKTNVCYLGENPTIIQFLSLLDVYARIHERKIENGYSRFELPKSFHDFARTETFKNFTKKLGCQLKIY